MFDVLLISYSKNKHIKIIQKIDFDLIITDKPTFENMSEICRVYPDILKLSFYESNDQHKIDKIMD